jgi:Htaa protein
MNSKKHRQGRALTCLAAMAATTVVATLFASTALAVAGSGQATILPADHAKGRTLSGQGVKLLAGAGASAQDGKLTLPIGQLEPSAPPSATSSGALRFKKGKRSVALTEIRFDIGAGALVGKLGGTEVPVFRLGAAAAVNPTAGSISLHEGALRLTAEAAQALKQKLGLPKALKHNGIGMLWISAQANPFHAAAQSVVSGSVNWGVLASWRKYVLGNFGPGSVGTITTGEGASAHGTLSEASAYFSFPAASGTYQRGLYGAADKLALQTAGSVKFAKPGHCIVEVKFSDLRLTIDGAASSVAIDSIYDIDSPPTCTENPAVATQDVQFATLQLGGIVPSHSADGKTVTWSAVPATLTGAGGTAWGAGYEAGEPLDPITISVGLG